LNFKTNPLNFSAVVCGTAHRAHSPHRHYQRADEATISHMSVCLWHLFGLTLQL